MIQGPNCKSRPLRHLCNRQQLIIFVNHRLLLNCVQDCLTTSAAKTCAEARAPQGNVWSTNKMASLFGSRTCTGITSPPYAISWDTTQTTDASHTITAVAKDSAGSTSPLSSVSVTVANSAAGFAFTPQTNSSTSATVAPGGTATYLLSLLSGASFSGTVSFTCSGAPAAAACYVLPVSPSISANSTVPITITVTTVAQSASLAQPRRGRGRAPFAFALTLLVPLALAVWQGRRRRKAIAQWVIGGLLALMIAMSSCGGGGAPPPNSSSVNKSTGTPAGSYTLTITGTNGTISRSISLTLIVT